MTEVKPSNADLTPRPKEDIAVAEKTRDGIVNTVAGSPHSASGQPDTAVVKPPLPPE